MTTATLVGTRETVLILAVNGGWSTIQRAESKEPSKVRNSALTDLRGDEPAELATGASKRAIVKRVKARLDEEQPEDDESEEETEEGVRIRADLAKYTVHPVATASGGKALDISDAAADLLRGQDISDCYFIVAKHLAKKDKTLDVDTVEAELKARYENLNLGMQRMNLGNKLRKAMGIYGNLNAHKTKPTSKAKKAAAAKRTTVPKVTRRKAVAEARA